MDENKKDYNTENETFDDKIELEKDLDVEIEDGVAEGAGMEISVEAASLEDAQAAAGGFNIWKEIREWVFAIVLALVVVGLIKGFLFDFVVVDGRSMQTTLMDGDRLVLTKWAISHSTATSLCSIPTINRVRHISPCRRKRRATASAGSTSFSCAGCRGSRKSTRLSRVIMSNA